MVVNFVSRRVKRAVKPYELPATIPFGEFIAWGRGEPMKPAGVTPDDIAFLQYTGGTTGVSKGATLTHRNVAANVLQCETWLFAQLDREARHVMYTALPLYHILALTACCMFMMRVGAMQVLIANPRDVPGLVKTLKTTPPSILVLVNTLYNALAQRSDIAGVDFSKLELCVSGGMATQATVARRWKEITGRPIIEGYGLSETSPLVCVNRLDIEEFTGGVGYPVSSTDVSIRAPDGQEAPQGQPGEICVKGPQVMTGYWGQAEETAKAMTPDGYFRTGDVGVMEPDGMIRIVDRMKDMIAVSGLKVFPNEVEDVLANHPQILEVAVVGVPDAHSGEAVAAYIVRRDETLTSEDVQKFARENLAPYKTPRRVEFRDSLPKTNVGKILRRELRDEAMKAAGASSE
jgi:long-chain acyl-CoA synthetase